MYKNTALYVVLCLYWIISSANLTTCTASFSAYENTGYNIIVIL